MNKIARTCIRAIFLPYDYFCKILFYLLNRPRVWVQQILVPDSDKLKRLVKRDSDIFLVSYPKSGTIWLQMLMYQLTTDGNIDSISHLFDFSPFLETSGVPESLPSPRIIKTHLDSNSLSPDKGKYIYLMRNGLDVAVSYYHHHRNFLHYQESFDSFYKEFLKGKVLYGSWFKHLASWMRYKDHPKVLFIRYEDMKMDFEKVVREIIDFCEFEISEERLIQVIKHCSFDYMKEKQDKIELLQFSILNLKRANKGKLLRQGEIGGGLKMNNEELISYNKQFSRYLSESDVDFYLAKLES